MVARRRAASPAKRAPQEPDPEADAAVTAAADRYLRFGPNSSVEFIVSYPQKHALSFSWKGTLFELVSKRAVGGVLLIGLLNLARVASTVRVFEVPTEADDPWVAHLQQLHPAWGFVLTLQTFALSALLSQSWAYWNNMKSNVRKIQGRLNDLCILLATHAARDAGGGYAAEAQDLLRETARHARLYQVLWYAHLLKPSMYRSASVWRAELASGHISLLGTDAGLAKLVERRLLTQEELRLLRSLDLPPTGWSAAVLTWLVSRFVEARRAGLTVLGAGGDAGFESTFLAKALELRSICATIPDELVARMPLAYVHIAQTALDTLLAAAPLALYPKLGLALSMLVATGLTLFYRGLLALAKSLLDPFGADGRTATTLSLEVLVCESNAGSTRWLEGNARLPFACAPGRKK